MGGVKRKEAPSSAAQKDKKSKVHHTKSTELKKPSKVSHLDAAARQDDDEEDFIHSRGNEKDQETSDSKLSRTSTSKHGPQSFKLETTSAEAHAKQRALAKERRAAKPNADAIQRSKQLWEKLRRKSHVPREERKKLVAELFELINGRVRDFVFKHDSVRVIQCAVKYAKADQLKSIVKELKGDVRDLVESRYGKFLVAKMVVQGDREDKDMMIPEFYGNVKRLINHPEASWIVDDIYRQVATPQQKAMMLREWYGPEFALFGKKSATVQDQELTADLVKILEEHPEKRRPILQYLHQMINNLIQKKMTGFTMLHDAMLQYFLALVPGSTEQSEFLETLKHDIDAEEEGGGGDLYRNLSFTRSGSRLVCLALTYGSAKDRKSILKCFKDHIDTMAFDQHAKMVLLTGLHVLDDTRNSYQLILRDLLGVQIQDEDERFDRLESIATDLNARLPLLFSLAQNASWLVKDQEKLLIAQIEDVRKNTSLKDPEIRRKELLSYMSDILLTFVSRRADHLIQSSFGCQAITEILLECNSDKRNIAKQAVAALAEGDPSQDGHISKDPAASRMLKSLVLGGHFDPASKQIKLSEPRLEFSETLFPVIKPHLLDWACGESSFVVVGLSESQDVPAKIQNEITTLLRKQIKKLQSAASETNEVDGGTSHGEEGHKKKKSKSGSKGNAGARILVGKLL